MSPVFFIRRVFNFRKPCPADEICFAVRCVEGLRSVDVKTFVEVFDRFIACFKTSCIKVDRISDDVVVRIDVVIWADVFVHALRTENEHRFVVDEDQTWAFNHVSHVFVREMKISEVFEVLQVFGAIN